MSKPRKNSEKKKAGLKRVASSTPTTRTTKTETNVEARLSASWHLPVIICLLTLMAAQMVWMAHSKSVTMDEPNHITRGIVYLRTGDLRVNRLHPPLINLLCALPLLPDRSLALPLNSPAWANADLDHFADQFLWSANQNGHSIVFRARLAIVVITLLLALTAYAWAREMFSPTAGLLALALVAFDPNLLAHGSLATNDMGVTAFSTLSLYTFWRWLRQPSRGRALVASVAFGLAQVSKFSAILLVPSLAMVALAYWFMLPADQRPRIRIVKALGWVSALVAVGVVVMWAVYGFKIGRMSGQGASIPASSYFEEMSQVLNRVGKGNPTFLFGSYSKTGWWYYFPMAFLVKTPLATLLMIGAALFFTWRRRTWKAALVLLIPVVVHFGVSIVSSFNIGYRHLLPALVPLLIFASQLAPSSFNWRSKPVWGGFIAMAWLAIGTLSNFPDHLAYFNEIVGGPSHGYKVLTDSNLDWGQDLIGLRKYMVQEGIPSVKFSYFGVVDPKAYGVEYETLPSYPRYIWRHASFPPFLLDPAPGVYAISATNLQGTLFEPHNMYAWFRDRQPDAVIGHTIFIYTVRDQGLLGSGQ